MCSFIIYFHLLERQNSKDRDGNREKDEERDLPVGGSFPYTLSTAREWAKAEMGGQESETLAGSPMQVAGP